ncbi:MAG TPA: propanediol/glycerol family dehydratase large subunit, partial [Sphingomicrobium sp.]|nr:propanediol/glycerol family dehydratase large subunit [Sphingomicrobium sp.]
MAGEPRTFANRWKRFSDWDERPLRLDKFAIEDADNGFASFTSRHDPKPGLALASGGIEVMDGLSVRDFDMIDTFIARYHIDPEIAPEAMAMPSQEVARMLVDMNVPRSELVRLRRSTWSRRRGG